MAASADAPAARAFSNPVELGATASVGASSSECLPSECSAAAFTASAFFSFEPCSVVPRGCAAGPAGSSGSSTDITSWLNLEEPFPARVAGRSCCLVLDLTCDLMTRRTTREAQSARPSAVDMASSKTWMDMSLPPLSPMDASPSSHSSSLPSSRVSPTESPPDETLLLPLALGSSVLDVAISPKAASKSKMVCAPSPARSSGSKDIPTIF
mmetsp:Transcript_4229/g.12537  ORF Transcript_4229/g.12537 Transcript_4229/m.12537 type:complete len:211 (-) Transcript_4229:630-1262(-)